MREGWRLTTLGEAAQVTMGRQRSPKHATGDHVVPYLRAANVKDGRLALDSVFGMNFSPDEQATFSLRPGDVLVTEGCGSLGQLGAAAPWDGEIGGTVCFQNTLLRLRAIAGLTDPGFVDVWARHAFSSGVFAAVASGTNIFHIGSTRAKQIPLLLPPLNDQCRIVHLMEAVDEERRLLKSVATAGTALATALRATAFEDPTVEAVLLRELCEADGIQIGPFGSQLHAHDYVADGVPTVMPKDIIDGRIDTASVARVGRSDWERLSKHHLREGDIVLPRRGDLSKRALVGPGQAGWLCGTGSLRVRVAKADPRVVYEALSSGAAELWLSNNAVGITMPNLNTAIVGRIPIRLPGNGEDVTLLLIAITEYRASCLAALEHSGTAERAVVADLLSGAHEIPDSYDALLESAS